MGKISVSKISKTVRIRIEHNVTKFGPCPYNYFHLKNFKETAQKYFIHSIFGAGQDLGPSPFPRYNPPLSYRDLKIPRWPHARWRRSIAVILDFSKI
jgi:hypothetical protein